MNDGEPREGEPAGEPSTQEDTQSSQQESEGEAIDRSQLPAVDISKNDLTRLINRIRKL
jgi:hypothetical protein